MLISTALSIEIVSSLSFITSVEPVVYTPSASGSIATPKNTSILFSLLTVNNFSFSISGVKPFSSRADNLTKSTPPIVKMSSSSKFSARPTTLSRVLAVSSQYSLWTYIAIPIISLIFPTF